MKRSYIHATSLAAASLLGSCGGASSQSLATAPVPTASADPAPAISGTLLFAEEFDTATLDRAKWNVEGSGFWVNDEQQAYIDSSDTIAFASPEGAEGGALILRARFRPGFETITKRKTDFVSGRINTSDKFAVTYGKVSARVRMADTVGAWPAFWMLGYGNWPDCGETDIMEYVGDKSWTSAAMHGPGYSGETPLVKKQNFPAGTDATGWHVYSVERTPDALVFSVDDREYYRVTRADVEKYGPWRFDRPQYIILNLALGGIYPFKENAVTKPYYGLPKATVDAVKAGKVTMEVDWVRAWAP